MEAKHNFKLREKIVKEIPIIAMVVVDLLLLFILGYFFIRPAFLAGKTTKVSKTTTPATKVTKQTPDIPVAPVAEKPKTVTPTQPTTTPSNPSVAPTPTVTAPVTTTSSLKIIGNDDCVAKTNQALALVQSKAPDSYAIITKYVGVISCADSGSGMYAWETPPRYQVGAATMNAGTMWYGGTIVHDSGHSKLYHDYLTAHPGESVPDNIWMGRDAEQKCLDLQYDALSKMGADQYTLDYVKASINTDYWNDPNRWW